MDSRLTAAVLVDVANLVHIRGVDFDHALFVQQLAAIERCAEDLFPGRDKVRYGIVYREKTATEILDALGKADYHITECDFSRTASMDRKKMSREDDYALRRMAKSLVATGVRQFLVVTEDGDHDRLAHDLRGMVGVDVRYAQWKPLGTQRHRRLPRLWLQDYCDASSDQGPGMLEPAVRVRHGGRTRAVVRLADSGLIIGRESSTHGAVDVSYGAFDVEKAYSRRLGRVGRVGDCWCFQRFAATHGELCAAIVGGKPLTLPASIPAGASVPIQPPITVLSLPEIGVELVFELSTVER